MSWLSRLFGRQPAILDVEGDESFDIEVVGESHYQEALERICGPRSEDGEDRIETAVLMPEKYNHFDSNAVAVLIDDQKVGYLSRPAAAAFRKLYRGGVRCKANIRGGWQRSKGKKDKGHYGVWLDL